MHKALKPALKDRRPVKKPPKQVTLMIESKMLEETQTRTDLRVSNRRSSKGMIGQALSDAPASKIISLKELSMSQRISSRQLRPSTSRERIAPSAPRQYDDEDFPFRPRINSKSRSLSKNRQLSQPKSCRHSKCTEEHDLPQGLVQTQLNPVSNFKCFERLLYRITSYFEHQQICWEFKQLNYSNVLMLLHRMGYLPHPTEGELVQFGHTDSLKKAYQFWLYVSADELTATLENFFLMICGIEKIHMEAQDISKAINLFVNYLCRKSVSFRMDPPEPPEYRWIMQRTGRTFGQNGELQLDRTLLAKVPGEFKLFIVNRLNSQQEKSLGLAEQNTNTNIISGPLLSERSNKLAERKRRKMIEIIRNRKPDVETVTLHDILNFKASPNQSERISMMTGISSQTNIIHQPARRQLRISASQLCFLARPKRVIERDPVDLEFERVEHICTFQPQIHDVRKPTLQGTIGNIRNADKSIERMKEGRLFRKQKKRLIETGWTNSESRHKLHYRQNKENQFKDDRRGSQPQLSFPIKQMTEPAKPCEMETSYPQPSPVQQFQQYQLPKHSFDFKPPSTEPTCQSSFKLPTQEAHESAYSQHRTETMRSEQKQLRIPLLFIDINIDETKKQRIVIYDQDSSQKLAEQFARRHNLDGEMQAKLRQLLEYQMSSILTKIEEQAEEQDNF